MLWVLRSGVCDSFSLVLGRDTDSLMVIMDWTGNVPSATLNATSKSPNESERISEPALQTRSFLQPRPAKENRGNAVSVLVIQYQYSINWSTWHSWGESIVESFHNVPGSLSPEQDLEMRKVEPSTEKMMDAVVVVSLPLRSQSPNVSTVG